MQHWPQAFEYLYHEPNGEQARPEYMANATQAGPLLSNPLLHRILTETYPTTQQNITIPSPQVAAQALHATMELLMARGLKPTLEDLQPIWSHIPLAQQPETHLPLYIHQTQQGMASKLQQLLEAATKQHKLQLNTNVTSTSMGTHTAASSGQSPPTQTNRTRHNNRHRSRRGSESSNRRTWDVKMSSTSSADSSPRPEESEYSYSDCHNNTTTPATKKAKSTPARLIPAAKVKATASNPNTAQAQQSNTSGNNATALAQAKKTIDLLKAKIAQLNRIIGA